jgi:AraC family transcriptional regulator, transcriptional activator of pobA
MSAPHHDVPTGRPVWARRFLRHEAFSVHPPVVHEFMALGFLTHGSAVVEQRGRYELRAGDVFLVPAGEKHRVVKGSSPEAWSVSFCPTCYAASDLAALLSPFERSAAGASAVIQIPGNRQEHVAALCAELHLETTRQANLSHGELAQKSLLGLILTEVARAAEVTSGVGLQPAVVADALRFIERHCLGPISLRHVAAAVKRSAPHVATVVKASTGKTVVEWITAGRLAEARNRLLHTDEFIDVIAERVGYADPTHFIRVFRRAHLLTPAAWRSMYRPRKR